MAPVCLVQLEVMSPCLEPCESFDNPLQPSPELEVVEWVVWQTCDQTIADDVRCHMVDMVMFMGEKNVPPLHPFHDSRHRVVGHVRPFMNLVVPG